jgi:hypothetical protein
VYGATGRVWAEAYSGKADLSFDWDASIRSDACLASNP